MKVTLILSSFFAAGLLAHSRAVVPVQEQQIVDLPVIQDTSGQAVDWTSYEKDSLILYFHKVGLKYSETGLTKLLAQLKKDDQARRHSMLMVVVFAQSGLSAVVDLVTEARVSAKVLLDQDHQAFRELKVIAFPTAYVTDLERHVVWTSKGYGPQAAVQIAVAARFGAGLLSAEQFAVLEEGKLLHEMGSGEKRMRRHVHLARRLAATGELQQALTDLQAALQTVRQEAPTLALDVDALELQTRLLLRLGQPQAASDALQDLIGVAPESRALPFLRCRLSLVQGDLEAAAAAIAGVRARRFPEVLLLRGRLLEAQGQFEQAAALYRDRLESGLFED